MHPILCQIGPVTIYTYGACVALAVLVAFVIANRLAGVRGLSKNVVADILFLLFITGVAGARLFYVLQHCEDYQGHLLKVFAVREGGLVWYGGFITAALVALVWAGIRKYPILKLCDFFVPLLALAHAIGRLGCFLNGCCYGRETTCALGVCFPGETLRRHPVQLYEAFFLLALAFFLFWRSSRSRREGEVFMEYLALYSVGRFILEFLRGDNRAVVLLTIPQWTSVVLFVGALFLLFYLRKIKR